MSATSRRILPFGRGQIFGFDMGAIKYKNVPIFGTEKDALEYMYIITGEGRIFRKDNGCELKSCLDHKGYRRIRLKNPQFSKTKDGRCTYKVHRVVAMFYLPDYSDELQVNHKNGNKEDNRVENLEMVTNKENVIHAFRVLDSSRRRARMAEFMRTRDAIPVVAVDLVTNAIKGRYESAVEAALAWETTPEAMYRRIKRGKLLEQIPRTGLRNSGKDFRGTYFVYEKDYK